MAEVEWMVAQLQDEWRQAGISAPTTLSGKRADPFWDSLSEFASGNSDGKSLMTRIHVLPSAVAGLVGRLRTLDPAVSIQAHAASGIVLARFSTGADGAAALVDDRLRPEVHSAGGHMIVLAKPPDAELGRQGLFGPVPDAWVVMQSIRRKFDPKGILNRGRFPLSMPEE